MNRFDTEGVKKTIRAKREWDGKQWTVDHAELGDLMIESLKPKPEFRPPQLALKKRRETKKARSPWNIFQKPQESRRF